MQNANLNLFTIGFTQKRAEDFFEIISNKKIKCLIDVRLNNQFQLAGYTKKQDLPFFLKTICSCSYSHIPEWASTKEILNNYKDKKFHGMNTPNNSIAYWLKEI